MTGLLLLWAGAAVGAPARYLTDRAVQARHDSLMPWGTLTANVTGSFLLGVLSGLAAQHRIPSGLVLAIGAGFCGALTTYSTFSYETMKLVESKAYRLAAANVLMSLTAGVGAAALGDAVTRTL